MRIHVHEMRNAPTRKVPWAKCAGSEVPTSATGGKVRCPSCNRRLKPERVFDVIDQCVVGFRIPAHKDRSPEGQKASKRAP